jgi:hypothetical protein
MARLGRDRLSADLTTPPNGTGAPGARPAGRYCGLCGQSADPGEAAIERFGEAFCSEAHADEFVQAVRAARVEAAVTGPTAVERAGSPANAATPSRDWKASLGKPLCWGVPLLVVALVLAGGTGALAGVAGAALPFLAILACPVGMYFMMRAMSKTGDHERPKDGGGDR